MTATTRPRDESSDDVAMLALLDERPFTRLADDLAIVHDAPVTVIPDELVTVITEDLAIVHDAPRIEIGTAYAPLVTEPRPILVDLTGRRTRVVRLLSLGTALTAVGLLASIPASLVAPERVRQAAGAVAAPVFAGSVFVDGNCDGVRTATEPALDDQAVELLRDGAPFAMTRTLADGTYAFDRVPVADGYVVRVVRAAAAPGEVAEDAALRIGISPVLRSSGVAEGSTTAVDVALPPTSAGCATALPRP